MNILGISAYYHDSAACLVRNGSIECCLQEERLSRLKFDNRFPRRSIRYCLKYADLNYKDIDYIVFYDKPFLKFERLLETYLAYAPSGFKSFCTSMPIWLKNKLFQKRIIINELNEIFDHEIESKKILFSEHHLSHAASAFFPSPFTESSILTMDGVGEWVTSSISIGNNNNIELLDEINFPHSLGLLYSAFTYFCGFKVNSGEYKLMGLAPYGKPKYVSLIRDNIVDIKHDGSFHLNMSYFNYCTGLTMTSEKFHKLFNKKPRLVSDSITQKDMDIAASIQNITEEILVKIAKNIKKNYQQKNLCLAGGVALNCVANGIISKEDIFDKIWVQPAPGDAGGALGSALAVHHMFVNKKRNINRFDSMQGSYLGPAYTQEKIIENLDSHKIIYSKFDKDKLIDTTAKLIADGNIIGWMQGKMEFGPRALGNRSILADPRSKNMQKKLNMKVKFRESFRPFAPCILSEYVEEWFDLTEKSPYMSFVAKIKDKHKSYKQSKLNGLDRVNEIRSSVPAITHIDFSARIQTVDKITNPLFYSLIDRFRDLTGCPLLINTSFNIRGEPIVCSPKDAINCFLNTDIDVLIIDNFIAYKKNQIYKKDLTYKDSYELD